MVLAGAGRVATSLGEALQAAGHRVVLVVSRHAATAARLAGRLGTPHATFADRPLLPPAEIIIYSVSDDALEEVTALLPPGDRLALHTAGSMPMEIFRGRARHYGVLYPLQTFSPGRRVDFSEVPLCIEGATPADEMKILTFARTLSRRVYSIPTPRRRTLHLAAVIVNNFVNHLYHLAGELLEKDDLPFELLVPLIRETAEKATAMGPQRAQTGPAVRNDENVIKKHLELLSCSPGLQELYRLMTESIRHHTSPGKKRNDHP